MTPERLAEIEERLRQDRCYDEDVWALVREVRRIHDFKRALKDWAIEARDDIAEVRAALDGH